MSAFTVALPGGNTDKEFQAYVDLLKEWGVDVSRLPRVPEPGTDRRWLHAWETQEGAERFAEELRKRTRNPRWSVMQIDDGRIGAPPSSPLTIVVSRKEGGMSVSLAGPDRERIAKAFPTVNVVPSIFISDANRGALEQAVWDPWDQVSTLLTGLSEEKRSHLGGVRITDQQSGKVLWSQDEPFAPFTTEAYNASIEDWIDGHATDASHLADVLQYLTDFTIGKNGENIGGIPHPPPTGYEGRLWPWNRAGGRYLEKGMVQEAAAVFAGCYLALLSLQHRYHFRTHKGMPLCNLGIALLRMKDRLGAVLCWLLGLAEDTMTNPETCLDTQNAKNLLSTQLPDASIRSFSLGIRTRFTDADVIAAYPELALDFGFDPRLRSFNEDVRQAITRLADRLARAFPNLPGDEPPLEMIRAMFTVLHVPESIAKRAHE